MSWNYRVWSPSPSLVNVFYLRVWVLVDMFYLKTNKQQKNWKFLFQSSLPVYIVNTIIKASNCITLFHLVPFFQYFPPKVDGNHCGLDSHPLTNRSIIHLFTWNFPFLAYSAKRLLKCFVCYTVILADLLLFSHFWCSFFYIRNVSYHVLFSFPLFWLTLWFAVIFWAVSSKEQSFSFDEINQFCFPF